MDRVFKREADPTAKISGTENERETGPKPVVVKIEGNWKKAVKKAVKKKRPKEGWPKSESQEESS